MTTLVRQELLHVLTQISELAPDVRLGQLIVNLSYMARGPSNASAWDAEDDELLEVARRHLERWRARQNASMPASVEMNIDPASLPHVSNP